MTETKASELKWAVQNGDLDKVKSICTQKGFDVNAASEGMGQPPLHCAADYGQSEIIGYLCSVGANPNLPDKHGITPLLAAIYEGHADCVKLLLEKGAKKDGKAPSGETYLQCAETDDIKALLK